MRFVNLPTKLTKELYIWLKKYAYDLGESMNTVIRKALTEYREKIERNVKH